MNKYFLCLLLIITVSADTKNSQEYAHTDIYKAYKNGSFTNTLYLKYTYLGNDIKNFDPCTPISDSYGRYIFIGILESVRKRCSGDWCDKNGGYGCMRNGVTTRECYEVEHIIDRKKSAPYIDGNLSRDILGNLIMAYGQWNAQLGYRNSLTWNDVQNEKMEIYGETIFKRALEAVEKCATDRNYYNTHYIVENDTIPQNNNSSISKKVLVIFSMVVFMAFCLIASMFIHKYIFSVETIEESSPETTTQNV